MTTETCFDHNFRSQVASELFQMAFRSSSMGFTGQPLLSLHRPMSLRISTRLRSSDVTIPAEGTLATSGSHEMRVPTDEEALR